MHVLLAAHTCLVRRTFSCASADMRARTSGFDSIALSTSGLRMCLGMRDIIICMAVGFDIITSSMRSNLSATGSAGGGVSLLLKAC